jgi:hypothetical protein
MYFRGDPHAAGDPFIKSSLIVEPTTVRTSSGSYEAATFDVVLAPR